MENEDCWPPRSARQAFLSSPSGRRKYQALATLDMPYSPSKQSSGTPSFLDKLRASRANPNRSPNMNENGQTEEEDEEDEETLQLKLAAIEAKLKLKRLQQSKGKRHDTALSQSSSTRDVCTEVEAKVEVPLSPTKRPQAQVRSPGRVLLGIDKGLKAADVSLRRAKTIGGTPSRHGQHVERRSRLTATRDSDRSRPFSQQSEISKSVSSFSARMAEMRDGDRARETRHEANARARSNRFQFDRKEVEDYRLQADSQQTKNEVDRTTRALQSKSALRKNIEGQHSDSQPEHDSETSYRGLSRQRSQPELRASPSKAGVKEGQGRDISDKPGDASLFEGFSGLNLSSRLLPHTFLKRTIPASQYTIYRIPDLLKQITGPTFELPDDIINYVVFGIVVSKSLPIDHKMSSEAEKRSVGSKDWEKKWDDGSQNRKKFMALTLTDLKWTIELYLFDTALPRYHRLTVGTVIAVLNPSIMPPRKGREDTGAFSLALNDGEDQVLEIGKSKDLGFCSATKRDGQPCGQWLNANKTEICEWHLNAQIAKTQSQRMGVNAGSNGFFGGNRGNNTHNRPESARGSGGHAKEGHRYDRWTGSHFYVAASSAKSAVGTGTAPLYNPEKSTAKLLDADNDDPFIAEGQLSRDREGLIQKRMAAQEKERQIAKRLGNLGSGGVAKEYMKQANQTQKHVSSTENGKNKENAEMNGNAIQRGILTSANKTSKFGDDLPGEISRKRAAESVRLSPVKKTRFLTDRGIKEAGRESFGGATTTNKTTTTNDDDDDDLDIV